MDIRLLPQLRFPEFAMDMGNSYKKLLFEDIFLFTTGKNIKQREASPEFQIPCIRYGELYYMYNEVIDEIINKTNLDKSELLFSKGNEILLPSAGEDPLDIGSASALTLDNVAIGRTINVLRPKIHNIYSQNYVAFYINKKLRKKISRLAKGSSISNVYNSDLKKLQIILPELQEQKKIASFLTSVNKKLMQLTKKKTLLIQYKTGLIQQLFGQEIRFKNKDGKDYPQWRRKKLKEFIKHKSIRNKSLDVKLVLSVSNTKGFITQKEQFDNYRVASKDVSNYKIVENKDVAYNPSRINVGSIAVLKNFERGIVSPMYVVFSVLDSMDLVFFEYLIQTHKFNFLVKKGCSGSVRDSLNFEDLEEFILNIPYLDEQRQIANFLKVLDQKIYQVNTQIEKITAFKSGLLQQIFV